MPKKLAKTQRISSGNRYLLLLCWIVILAFSGVYFLNYGLLSQDSTKLNRGVASLLINGFLRTQNPGHDTNNLPRTVPLTNSIENNGILTEIINSADKERILVETRKSLDEEKNLVGTFYAANINHSQEYVLEPEDDALRIASKKVKLPNLITTPTERDLSRSKADRHFNGRFIGHLLSSTNPRVRNLVLGLASNIDPKNLAIFCGSLRETSMTTEGIVFVNAPVSDRHINIATEYQVVLVEYNVSSLEPEYLQHFHPSSLRWILFNRMFHQNGDDLLKKYDRVLFADVRDTYFQTNPFKSMPQTKEVFFAFAENLGQLIRDCGWNSGWIRDCFGQSALEFVSNSTIICSGISMGTMDRVSEYLDLMSRILTGRSMLGSHFPRCERNGVDQGVHNVIVNLGLLTSHTVHFENTFPVTHMQSTMGASAFDPERPTFVTLDTVNPLAVVHQYDRIHSIQMALAVKYVTWVNMKDPEETWKAEESCAKYTVVKGEDVFRGQCEYGSFRSMLASSCCSMCDSRKVDGKSCRAFAYSEGVCYFKSCGQDEVAAAVKVYTDFVKQKAEELAQMNSQQREQHALEDGFLQSQIPPGLMCAYS